MKSAACLRQWSTVYAAKMEHISVFLSVWMCVYIRECVEMGVAPGEGGGGNAPVCGLTKLSFCPQQ